MQVKGKVFALEIGGDEIKLNDRVYEPFDYIVKRCIVCEHGDSFFGNLIPSDGASYLNLVLYYCKNCNIVFGALIRIPYELEIIDVFSRPTSTKLPVNKFDRLDIALTDYLLLEVRYEKNRIDYTFKGEDARDVEHCSKGDITCPVCGNSNAITLVVRHPDTGYWVISLCSKCKRGLILEVAEDEGVGLPVIY